MKQKSIFLLHILVLIVFETWAQEVNTSSGPIQGKVDGNIFEFLGIPFAAPPTGDLRWKASVEPEDWTEILNTTEFAPVCPQKRYEQGDTTAVLEGDEDCLYLNVWTPHLNAGDLPVMVFIHGGGNQQGGASQKAGGITMYHGKNLSERGNVVVVTIQYRLGPLGFLVHPGLDAENEKGISGNYGILDQILALKWVQQNISFFGGDPDKVMIFGESAGGVDVGDLLVSPLASGLFHRAAIQSAVAVVSSYSDAQSKGIDFVNRYQPAGNDSGKIEAMRNIPAETLIKDMESPIQGGLVKSEWHPALDGVVFTDFPMTKVQLGDFNKVPLIIGSNADEMSVSAPTVVTPALLNLLVQTLIPAQYRSQVLNLYPPGETNEQARKSYVGILTDSQFSLPVRRTAQCISLNQDEPVWRYFLTFKHTLALLEKYGSYHGMELLYLFNNWENTLLGGGIFFQPQDDSLQNVLLNYWVNFARTGNPNAKGMENWPQYSASEDCYLEINATPIGTNCRIRNEKLDLWEEIAGFSGCVSTGHSPENVVNDIQIFPNPVSNIIYYSSSGNERLQLKVINSTGQKLDLQIDKNSIDISGLNSGFYFVQFETEKGMVSKKMIIQR